MAKTVKAGGAGLMAAFALVAIVDFGGDDASNYIFDHATQADVTFTVDSKERVNISQDDSRYMIWATKANGEKEVFEDTDTMSFWKYNSADVYGQLQPGKTYDAHVSGWRWPLFSMNRNIITVTPK